MISFIRNKHTFGVIGRGGNCLIDNKSDRVDALVTIASDNIIEIETRIETAGDNGVGCELFELFGLVVGLKRKA
jgi:hypothetical protein